MSLPGSYFDDLYAAAEDPWSLRTRWYEQRKYALTTAVLPRRRYADAVEVGCSVGELTAALAQRCDRLTAWDVSAAAVEQTRLAMTAHINGKPPAVFATMADEPGIVAYGERRARWRDARRRMEKAARALARPDAAKVIVDRALELVGPNC